MSEDTHNTCNADAFEQCHGCGLFMAPKGQLCPTCANGKKPRRRIFLQPPRISFERVCQRAESLYQEAKYRKGFPRNSKINIGSDQVRCMALAIVEAVNEADVMGTEDVGHVTSPAMNSSAFATAELALNVARAKLQQARQTIEGTGLEPRLCVEIDNVLLWLGDTALTTVKARHESEVRA